MSKSAQEILARIGALAMAGELPMSKKELLSLLCAEGYTAEEVGSVLSETDPLGSAKAPSIARVDPLAVAQLSDEATRFLNLLRHLGYLDDLMEDEVLDGVLTELGEEMEQRPGQELRNIELDDLRSHVATVLFDRQYELTPETLRLLEEEWRVVFH